MTNEELNRALYDKMSAEQEQYRASLLAMPPGQILEHAFEYAAREDILTSMEFHSLGNEEARALLHVEHPLEKLFHAYEAEETEIRYMALIHECVENEAHNETYRQWTVQRQYRETPLYLFPGAYAREHEELDQYRASRKAGIACRKAIDSIIDSRFQGFGMDDPSAAVREVAETFGYERMMYVLAATLHHYKFDGRYSGQNKNWAHTVPVHKDDDGTGGDRNSDFVLRSHPAKADAFITAARHEYLLSQPLTWDEIKSEAWRIFYGLKMPKDPNSPDRTHYMTENSPDFLARANDKDRDALFRLLPFQTIVFTSLESRGGTFAVISGDENRASCTALKKIRAPAKRKKRPER